MPRRRRSFQPPQTQQEQAVAQALNRAAVAVMFTEALPLTFPGYATEPVDAPQVVAVERPYVPPHRPSLEDRVRMFQNGQLKDQPEKLHMPTAILIQDLMGEIQRLRNEVAELSEADGGKKKRKTASGRGILAGG